MRHQFESIPERQHLVEVAAEVFPSVVIECGRAGDPDADRVAWEGSLASAYPGQHLVVRIPDVSPHWLQPPVFEGGPSVAQAVAEAVKAFDGIDPRCFVVV